MTSSTLTSKFERAQVRALQRLAFWFSARCAEEIRAVKWPFPTEPKIRDIIASGALLNSQGITIDTDGSFTIHWAVDYAAEVHEGFVTRSGRRYPPRRWTELPLQELPAQYSLFLAQELNSAGP